MSEDPESPCASGDPSPPRLLEALERAFLEELLVRAYGAESGFPELPAEEENELGVSGVAASRLGESKFERVVPGRLMFLDVELAMEPGVAGVLWKVPSDVDGTAR